MLNRKVLFSPSIYERGRDCEKDGAVVGLHRAGTVWEAMVVGTELYRVQAQISRGEVISLICNCPHANKGNRCKHMAAAFWALENRAGDCVNDDDAKLSKRVQTLPTDEAEFCLQLAIDCNSTRCTALLLNLKSEGDAQKFSPDEFTLDDLPDDALSGETPDRQGDNAPLKLLFPEEYESR